jgi:spermidine synthase
MATHGNRGAPLVAAVDFGVAELHPDPARPQGWTLLVDGVPQSYVDLADPTYLPFEYVRRLATVVRLGRPPRVPMKVLHLGGGGLTLARFVAATRPGSAQTVVDRDGELLRLVLRVLPPAAPLRIITGDARAVLEEDQEQRYDLIVVDVFEGAWMAPSVTTTGFAAAAAGALRPGGLLAMNLTDLPPLAYSRIQAATLRTAFGDVAVIGSAAMLRGRRAGNVVLVAGHHPGGVPAARLAQRVARDPEPGRVLHERETETFIGGARARLDELE